jgi:hypothetical protein
MCHLSCAATAAIPCKRVVDQHHLGHTEARVCLQPTNAHVNTTCTLHSRHVHAPQVHVRPNRPCSSSASRGGSGACLPLACVVLWALTNSLPFLYIVVTTDCVGVSCVALKVASDGHWRLSSPMSSSHRNIGQRGWLLCAIDRDLRTTRTVTATHTQNSVTPCRRDVDQRTLHLLPLNLA